MVLGVFLFINDSRFPQRLSLIAFFNFYDGQVVYSKILSFIFAVAKQETSGAVWQKTSDRFAGNQTCCCILSIVTGTVDTLLPYYPYHKFKNVSDAFNPPQQSNSDSTHLLVREKVTNS